MRYSYNQDKEGVVFANMKDINASYKDLGAVCAEIRYKSIPNGIAALDRVILEMKPILYRKHNINMGARHELHGRKGRTPIKCARIVKKVLVNAAANATNKGLEPDFMYVVHASANKTLIARRFPSKGSLYVTGGPSGQVPARHSDLEFARVEIGVSVLDEKKLSKNIVSKIKFNIKNAPKEKKKEEKKGAKKEKKPLLKIQKQETKREEKKEEKAPEQKKDAPKQEPPKELTPKEKTELEKPTQSVVEQANQ